MKELFLNVSELPAPEPFGLIMQAVTTLPNDSFLKVVHRKQPLLLYKPLQDLGYQFHVQTGEEFPFEIFIWKNSQAQPSQIMLPNIANMDASV